MHCALKALQYVSTTIVGVCPDANLQQGLHCNCGEREVFRRKRNDRGLLLAPKLCWLRGFSRSSVPNLGSLPAACCVLWNYATPKGRNQTKSQLSVRTRDCIMSAACENNPEECANQFD